MIEKKRKREKEKKKMEHFSWAGVTAHEVFPNSLVWAS